MKKTLIFTVLLSVLCLLVFIGGLSATAFSESVVSGAYTVTPDSKYTFENKTDGEINYSLNYEMIMNTFPSIEVKDLDGKDYYLYSQALDKSIDTIDISVSAESVEKKYEFFLKSVDEDELFTDLKIVIDLIPLSINSEGSYLFLNSDDTKRTGSINTKIDVEYKKAPLSSVKCNGTVINANAFDCYFYSSYSDINNLSKALLPTQLKEYYASINTSSKDGRFSVNEDSKANCFKVIVNKNTTALTVNSQIEVNYTYSASEALLIDIIDNESNYEYVIKNSVNGHIYTTLADILADKSVSASDGGFVSMTNDVYAGQMSGLVLEYKENTFFTAPVSNAFTVKVKRLSFTMSLSDCTFDYTGERIKDEKLSQYVISEEKNLTGLSYQFFIDELGTTTVKPEDMLSVGIYYYKAIIRESEFVTEVVSDNIAKLTVKKATVIITVSESAKTHNTYDAYIPSVSFNNPDIELSDCLVTYTDSENVSTDVLPTANGVYAVKIEIVNQNNFEGSVTYNLTVNVVQVADCIDFVCSFPLTDNTYTTTYSGAKKKVEARLNTSATPEMRTHTLITEYRLNEEGAIIDRSAPTLPGEYVVTSYLTGYEAYKKECLLLIRKAVLTLTIKNQTVTYTEQLVIEDVGKVYEVSGFVGTDTLLNVKDDLPNIGIVGKDSLQLTKDMTEDSYPLTADLSTQDNALYTFELNTAVNSTLTLKPKKIKIGFKNIVADVEEIASINPMSVVAEVVGVWQNVTVDELFKNGISLNYVYLGSSLTDAESYLTEITTSNGSYNFVLSPQTIEGIEGKYTVEYTDTETQGVLYVKSKIFIGRNLSVVGDLHPNTVITVTSPSQVDIERASSTLVPSSKTGINVYTIANFSDKGCYGDTFYLRFKLNTAADYDKKSIVVVSKYSDGREKQENYVLENDEVVIEVKVSQGSSLYNTIAQSYVIFADVKVDYTLYIIIGAIALVVIAGVTVAVILIVKKKRKDVKEAKENVQEEDVKQEVVAVKSTVGRRKDEELDEENIETFKIEKKAPVVTEEEEGLEGLTDEEKALEIKKRKRLKQLEKEQADAQKAALSAMAKEDEEKAKKAEEERIRLEQEEAQKEKRRLWEEKWANMSPEEKQAYRDKVKAKKEQEERAKQEALDKAEQERKARIAEKEKLNEAMFESYTRKTDEEIAREKAKAELDMATKKLAQTKNKKTVILDEQSENMELDDTILTEDDEEEQVIKTSDSDEFTFGKKPEQEPVEEAYEPEVEGIDLDVSENEVKESVDLRKQTEQSILEQNKEIKVVTAKNSRASSMDFDELDMGYAAIVKNGMYPKARTIIYDEAKALYPNRKLDLDENGNVVSASYFESELNLCDNVLKYFYSEIKNKLVSFGFDTEYSKRFENYSYNGELVLKLAFVNKRLSIMLKEKDADLFENLIIENLQKDRKYTEYPLCFNIQTPDDMSFFDDILAKLKEQLSLEKSLDFVAVNYIDKYPYIDKLYIDDKRRM